MQSSLPRGSWLFVLTLTLVLAKAALPDTLAAQQPQVIRDTVYLQAPRSAQAPASVQPPAYEQPSTYEQQQQPRYAEQPRYVEAPARITVQSELKSMSQGSYNAFSTTVEGADRKLAAAVWKDLVKEYGGKVKRSKPEAYKTEAVVVRSIGGSDPVDLFVDFDERGDDVLTRVWVRYRGDFIGPLSARRDVAATESLLTEYHVLLRRAVVSEEVAAEQKQMERLERDLADIAKNIARAERDIENARRDIEQANATIARAEGDIATGEANTIETQSAIAKQVEALQAVQAKLALIKA